MNAGIKGVYDWGINVTHYQWLTVAQRERQAVYGVCYLVKLVAIWCCSVSSDRREALGTYVHTVATSLCTLPAVSVLNPYRIVVSADLCLCLCLRPGEGLILI